MDPGNSTKSIFETENGQFVDRKYTLPESKFDAALGTYQPYYTDKPYYTQGLDSKGKPIPGTAIPVDEQFNPTTGKANKKNIANKKMAGGSHELGRELEARALQWEKDFSIDALDGHRKFLFDIEKNGAAQRLKDRTSVEAMADDAAEQALKDTVYNAVQAEATKMGKPPDFVRNLKKTQALLYDLTDTLAPQDVKLANKEAMRRGTPLFQRANVTVGVHPSGIVGTAHGIKDAIVDNPKSLKSASKNIRRTFPETAPSGKVKAATKRLVLTGVAGGVPDRNIPEEKDATVKMKAPDGSTKDVPPEKVELLKSHGAVVVQ
jgi:hypothetical protein